MTIFLRPSVKLLIALDLISGLRLNDRQRIAQTLALVLVLVNDTAIRMKEGRGRYARDMSGHCPNKTQLL